MQRALLLRADILRQRLSLARVMVSGLLCLAKVTVSRMCRAGEVIIAGAWSLSVRCVVSGHPLCEVAARCHTGGVVSTGCNDLPHRTAMNGPAGIVDPAVNRETRGPVWTLVSVGFRNNSGRR